MSSCCWMHPSFSLHLIILSSWWCSVNLVFWFSECEVNGHLQQKIDTHKQPSTHPRRWVFSFRRFRHAYFIQNGNKYTIQLRPLTDFALWNFSKLNSSNNWLECALLLWTVSCDRRISKYFSKFFFFFCKFHIFFFWFVSFCFGVCSLVCWWLVAFIVPLLFVGIIFSHIHCAHYHFKFCYYYDFCVCNLINFLWDRKRRRKRKLSNFTQLKILYVIPNLKCFQKPHGFILSKFKTNFNCYHNVLDCTLCIEHSMCKVYGRCLVFGVR